MNKSKYWSPEHYETKVVTGSDAACMTVYESDKRAYPPMQYGTHIADKSGTEIRRTIVIKRFKTTELCRIHTLFPPTYLRNEDNSNN